MQEISLLDRKLIRKEMREKRRRIAAAEQQQTGLAIAEVALSQLDVDLGEHIALFMSADGEVDTTYLMDALLQQGKACYLPVLELDTTTLQFRRYLPDTPLIANDYGLLEPGAEAPVIAPHALTTVFMPLVAFDNEGNRLGMGKGYYDKTFAFLKEGRRSGPALIGLAHECQRVEKLEAAAWDVPLGGIITGEGFHRFR